jgi:hypothetical protein
MSYVSQALHRSTSILINKGIDSGTGAHVSTLIEDELAADPSLVSRASETMTATKVYTCSPVLAYRTEETRQSNLPRAGSKSAKGLPRKN